MTLTDPGNQGREIAELLGRIRAGEPSAEEELVRRFSRGLSIMLRRLAADPSLAEDLHQETFRVVLGKARAGEIREPEKFLGFLRSTARHLWIGERRKSARRNEPEAVQGPTGGATAAAEPPQLRRLLRSEEAGRVRRLLGELRFVRDREILVRYYLSDESKERICDELGVEPARFKKVLYRARTRMRELWEHTEKRQQLFVQGAT